ncbi:MAG: urea ABC transporter permease subunit UrtB [Nitrospinaceae bacterium]|jgi:urea transport system permease protein|nr:urea ABC transporter permease subunit UrtB [Nitrospinaceae bacterium]|tara:strand:+ start:1919 stop:3604 length:1686 start_codon:yes stop_codon:yes gene_type:complete
MTTTSTLYKYQKLKIEPKSRKRFIRFFGFFLLLAAGLLPLSLVEANDFESALKDLGNKSRSKIKIAVKLLGDMGNPAALPALEALRNKRLQISEGGALIILDESGDQGHDALSGKQVDLNSLKLRTPRINNSVRRVLSVTIGKLQLTSDDSDVRLAAAKELLKRPSSGLVVLVENALAKESDDEVREIFLLVLAKEGLNSDDKKKRLQSLKTIKEIGNNDFKTDLEALLGKDEKGEFLEKDPTIRKSASQAISSIERRQFFINQAANLFYGLSLGSILLLAALGLAITFGLMGVINMAHGEMLMIGAYSTFVVQNLFKEYLPGFFDWYLVAAIPIAFTVSAIIGIILERSVIRHLYGRPLETLLATWGISLILIQSVRLVFGAQNVEVANPYYLAGGVEVMNGVVLPYSRIAIIIFVVFVVISVWTLLQKTSLGLQVRAVTQNRGMASCMGISTHKVDMYTFGLGSGVAGLGGLALSQIGNVGPELGQLYIVDSFMVVVLGGVGKIAGTVVGALGLGFVNKFLEPIAGAVLGKIIVLVLIIALIQKRPQGLFALKGRMADN